MSNLFDGLSMEESHHFHVICAISELQWSDFTVRVECELARDRGRAGRRLVNVLYQPSRQQRTYRAGTGNRWMPAFEEDIQAYCFFSLSRNASLRRRENSGSSGKV